IRRSADPIHRGREDFPGPSRIRRGARQAAAGRGESPMRWLRAPIVWVAAVAVVVAAGTYVALRRAARLPSPGSPKHEEVVRRFYRGLATLEVGLLDDAKREFTQAAMVVPDEPASLGNLGLAQLRLGDFDGAAQAIQKAVALAPTSSEVAFLDAQLEKSRGRQDAAAASLR